jgi:hypothetical protein
MIGTLTSNLIYRHGEMEKKIVETLWNINDKNSTHNFYRPHCIHSL